MREKTEIFGKNNHLQDKDLSIEKKSANIVKVTKVAEPNVDKLCEKKRSLLE